MHCFGSRSIRLSHTKILCLLGDRLADDVRREEAEDLPRHAMRQHGARHTLPAPAPAPGDGAGAGAGVSVCVGGGGQGAPSPCVRPLALASSLESGIAELPRDRIAQPQPQRPP
jgi:hypothetical protein